MQTSSRNDIYSFSSSGQSVTLLQTSGDVPSRRIGHGSVLVNKVLVVWGGDTRTDGQPDTSLDEGLYMLNLITSEWTRIIIYGPSPNGRHRHTVAYVKTKLYVFGGQADDSFMNDLCVFDLHSLKNKAHWELVKSDGKDNCPSKRAGHTSVVLGTRIYIFGGRDSQIHHNDTWCFDTDTRQWTKLKCTGYMPSPREGHAAAFVSDIMYVFGGRGFDGSLLGDLVALNITQQRWYTFQDMGRSPNARWGHTMASVGTRVFVLGGESFAAGQEEEQSVIHVLDTEFITYSKRTPATTYTKPSLVGEAV